MDLRRLLVRTARGVETLAARSLAVLDADARPEAEPSNDNLAAIRRAQRTATESGDRALANQLAEIEKLLVRSEVAADEPFALPTHRGRTSSHDELEDIRRRLLANTPRPLPTDRD